MNDHRGTECRARLPVASDPRHAGTGLPLKFFFRMTGGWRVLDFVILSEPAVGLPVTKLVRKDQQPLENGNRYVNPRMKPPIGASPLKSSISWKTSAGRRDGATINGLARRRGAGEESERKIIGVILDDDGAMMHGHQRENESSARTP